MRLFVSAWSLRDTIQKHRLTLPSLPAFVQKQGFQSMELSDRQLSRTTVPELKQFSETAHRIDCDLIIDIGCDLTVTDYDRSQREVNHVLHMLDVAEVLRAASVRICLGGQSFSLQGLLGRWRSRKLHPQSDSSTKVSTSNFLKSLMQDRRTMYLAHLVRQNMSYNDTHLDEKIANAVSALRRIMCTAEHKKLSVGIENHWGISTRPKVVMHIISEVGSEWLGTCVDFGNFPRGEDKYAGINLLLGRAVHVQAKSLRFTSKGEESSIDYQRCIQLLKDHGYDGTIAVEYEGPRDGLQGCLKTRRLIEKYFLIQQQGVT